MAIASSLDAVFRFNRKARIHESLGRRFTDLSAKLATWQPVAQNLSKAKVERLKIERDEPPVRRLIDLQAYNEECRAMGKSEADLIPLSGWQRAVGYVFTPGMRKIEKWKADREAQLAGAAAAAAQ